MSDQTGAPPGPLAGLASQMSAHHDNLAARSASISTQLEATKRAEVEMAKLARLGEAITPDEVIESAAKMIGSNGADPVGMAAMLSDMPENGGAALAAWVQQHDQRLKQQLVQTQQAAGLAAHQAGVAGFHALLADHVHEQTQGAPGPSVAPGANSLMPSASAQPPASALPFLGAPANG
jgi:hypothetical protein